MSIAIRYVKRFRLILILIAAARLVTRVINLKYN